MYCWLLLQMKSSFTKRNKHQIKKKRVRHAILLCTEPIHCSINVSCQIAIFPCLNVLQDAVPFQTAISAEPVFSLNAICTHSGGSSLGMGTETRYLIGLGAKL